MSNDNQLIDLKAEGRGTFVPPAGLTAEEAERLAREADEQRKDQ